MRRQVGAPAAADGPYPEAEERIASSCPPGCESLERAARIAAELPFAGAEPQPVTQDRPRTDGRMESFVRRGVRERAAPGPDGA
ncbi:hypothetical protein [Streptomyces sp. NPDC059816]|uniref:hypothetical protein n=1 Tax=Streptomyces sp. NPDC059816 TaxID=3346960 RepID=UPI00365FDF41